MSAATDVMAELALLEDPKLRAANEERGDDHGVNLSAMRVVRPGRQYDKQRTMAMAGLGTRSRHSDPSNLCARSSGKLP